MATANLLSGLSRAYEPMIVERAQNQHKIKPDRNSNMEEGGEDKASLQLWSYWRLMTIGRGS